MAERIFGPCDVTLAPQAPGYEGADEAIARMSIDKQFYGDLEAVRKGQMLAFRSAIDGSAGYVAMARVTGTLKGRQGSFVLQHNDTMTRGLASLSVTVVPDSGTDDLVGLAGAMNIIINGKKHSYDFEYSLTAQR